ncbi:FG-GAP-like repeat-containing protein [Ohtaekwangia sp.]|uniref:FG-GAP-like repeat-containing protein n=1 Tax=Ohtaekwangia sp. TaxID=2066019 RepID=UPI002FDD04C9
MNYPNFTHLCMKYIHYVTVGFPLLAIVLVACTRTNTCHEEMIAILASAKEEGKNPKNQYVPEVKMKYMDSLLSLPHSTPSEIAYCKYLKANILLELGREEEAIELFEYLVNNTNTYQAEKIWKDLALTYLRVGERSNCISNHAAESCLLPIKGLGVHRDGSGSRKAIAIYEKVLTRDPRDLESRWLLNIAYMTLGEYPDKVPAQFLLPDMQGDTTNKVNSFIDIAADLKLDLKNMAGASIADDFDNDGYMDIVTCGWSLEDEINFFRNKTDGTFEDRSAMSGLKGISGGLNMVQTDYNNDGYKDIFVLRGAWKGEYGEDPNSLLRNNGDGTFTDVTTQSGLLSFHPTQTATWNDFNNDGWVDVFIGNEASLKGIQQPHPCELYINNQDGTFTEVAAKTNSNFEGFVKSVTSGDYDNDGWKDIFISTMNRGRHLFRNKGMQNGQLVFEDVSRYAGIDTTPEKRTFPSWFWDFDNDGWLDIFVCDYTFDNSLAYYAASEKLHVPAGSPDKMFLYHNNHDGTFTNVAKECGLDKMVFAMGSNFGDIDNDGYLDMYLGTGNPNYQSLVPNKMFRNVAGKKFVDVTASARVGHLQKGHGVSFADMDNDGDQDIYIDMGGAFPGDAYQNSFFMNPGQGDNHWISIQLEGTKANRLAIGSRIKITCTENGRQRTIYRDVNSGGSFGSSPLRREIGLGRATQIDALEIRWHGSNTTEVFRNIKADQFIKITEGTKTIVPVKLQKINWVLPEKLCGPLAVNN